MLLNHTEQIESALALDRQLPDNVGIRVVSVCNECVCSQETCPYIALSIFRSIIAVEMQ